MDETIYRTMTSGWIVFCSYLNFVAKNIFSFYAWNYNQDVEKKNNKTMSH